MRDTLTARMWEDVKTKSRFGYDVLYSSVTEYNVARVSRMSAAVAYRTLFALTPVFIISVGVLGFIVGSDTEAQKDINEAITAAITAKRGFIVATNKSRGDTTTSWIAPKRWIPIGAIVAAMKEPMNVRSGLVGTTSGNRMIEPTTQVLSPN